MILKDPCPNSLSLLPTPFLDMVFETGGESQTQNHQLTELVSISTTADCGSLSIDFFNDD